MLANANATANLGYQGYGNALNLYNQSLTNKLSAGNQMQTQNQNLVNASQPGNLYSTSNLASMLTAFAPYFTAYPTGSQGSSTSTGAFGGVASPLQQLGGLGLAAYGTKGINNALTSLGNLFSPSTAPAASSEFSNPTDSFSGDVGTF
jgi:hypothetical protein